MSCVYLEESPASVAVVVVTVTWWPLSLLRGAVNLVVLLLFVDCVQNTRLNFAITCHHEQRTEGPDIHCVQNKGVVYHIIKMKGAVRHLVCYNIFLV